MLGKGISPGNMEWVENENLDCFSNIIGAPVRRTAASCYTVLGMAAPNLYGYYQNALSNWKQWVFPQAKVGDNIYLTIDSNLQSAVYDSVKQFKNAAVTIINYKTGEILSMVSLPGFDLKDSSQLVIDENGFINTTYNDSCYINKNLQTSFLPGSVIKPILLGIALDINPNFLYMTYECKKDNQTFNGLNINCYDGKYHGNMDFESSLCYSCNGYPITLISQISETELDEGLKQWGFEQKQFYENRFASISNTFYGNDEHSTVNRILGTIGQANCRVSVWHLTAMYGSIFNGGIQKSPILFYDNPEKLGQAISEERRVCSENTANILKNALSNVVEKGTGTVYDMSSSGIIVAGKTGTADVNITTGERTVWAVAGILNEETPYAITVCLPAQDGNASGSHTAGPVMKTILQKLLNT